MEAKPDYVFPYFIVNGLPIGLRGLLIASIFSGGMLGLFLLGCIPQRINRWAALAGCVAGIVVIGWISLADLWQLPGIHLHPYLAIVLGTSVIFLVGFLATLLVKGRK